MRVELCFKELDCPKGRTDMVPFLVAEGAIPENCVHVTSQDDFELQVREVHDGSTRCRDILLVTGRDAAMALARLRQEEDAYVSIVTHIADETWAVGTTMFDGSFDSGMPAVMDLRENGTPIEFGPGLQDIFLGVSPLSPGASYIVEIGAEPRNDPQP
ncbi:hypothetical protein LAZ40_02285 [Cereibacter sphaeroides]|uniref:hypothetical protein n=1 Tax=Cereibacter sphaeroides TaxID=1063 RepID=UPI001F467F15|nr:hypothetical protein [Cereibacter sphaeroides]MCE6957886.1 hypothetical protein [Cereibacter sphaeroides]MCE6971855.1 hypothetical protein [Cereibacter sphaeroides]